MTKVFDASDGHEADIMEWKNDLPNHLNNISPKDVTVFSAVGVVTATGYELHIDGAIKLPGFKNFYFSAVLEVPNK